jgi:hypothetical protein
MHSPGFGEIMIGNYSSFVDVELFLNFKHLLSWMRDSFFPPHALKDLVSNLQVSIQDLER